MLTEGWEFKNKFVYLGIIKKVMIKITEIPQKELVADQVISMLNSIEVDGETMQHILKNTNMEDQMLRQLLLQADSEVLFHLIMERRGLGNA